MIKQLVGPEKVTIPMPMRREAAHCYYIPETRLRLKENKKEEKI